MNSKKYYLNNDVCFLKSGSKYLLINEFSKKWFFCDEKSFKTITKSLENRGKDKKEDHIEDNIPKLKEILSQKIKPEMKDGIIIMHMTNKCNLNCTYCYIKKEENIANESNIYKALNKVLFEMIEAGITNITINFHGGEPLICKSDIDKIINYIDKTIIETYSDLKVYYRIQTNGTILDNHILELLNKKNIFMSISLDGNEKIHNKSRVFKNGQGSFNTIMENLQILNSKSINYQVISTVDESTNYTDLVKYFYSKNILNAKFSFLFDENIATKYSKENQILMSERYIECIKWIIKTNKTHSNKIRLNNIAIIIRTLLLQENKYPCINNECLAGKNIFSIDFKGNILPCDNFNLLKNNDGFKKSINELADISSCKFNLDEYKTLDIACKKCNYLFLCGGGCIVESSIYKDTKIKRNILCEFNQKLYDYIFSLLFKDYKELLNLI